MVGEKCKGEKAIADNEKDCLNDLQKNILPVVEKYGWSLKFVRRSENEAR